MARWTCRGCAPSRQAGRHTVPCPLCCGYTSVTAANARLREQQR